MSNTDVYIRRARLAVLSRHHGPDHPLTIEARQALGEEKFVNAVQRALEAAPPLSDAVRQRVVGLLTVGNQSEAA